MNTLCLDVKRLVFQYVDNTHILASCPTPGILQHFVITEKAGNVSFLLASLTCLFKQLQITHTVFTGNLISWVQDQLTLPFACSSSPPRKRRMKRIHYKMKRLFIKCILSTFPVCFWSAWKQETKAWTHLRKCPQSSINLISWETLRSWIFLIAEVSSCVKSIFHTSALLHYPWIHEWNRLKNSWIEIDQVPESVLKQLSYDEMFKLHPKEKSHVLNGDTMIHAHRWYQSYLKVPTADSCYSLTYMFADSKQSQNLPVLPKPFQILYDYINQMNQKYQYNHVQVNWYADGKDYVPYHSDWEKDKTPDSNITIVSLNPDEAQGKSTRQIRFKAKKSGGHGLSLPLLHGRIIRMCGSTQSDYRHSILRDLNYPYSRISVTFRAFV